MKKRCTQIGVLIMVLLMVSCVTTGFVSNGYKTLSVSKQAYDTTLSVLGDLYKQGTIGEDVKAQAIEIGNLYMIAHNEAVSALLAYESSEEQTDKDKYTAALADASVRLARLLEFIKPYIK